ncbi:MAG: TlpA family protein disulfide reductase [Saprospiraceae bacterium]
MNTIRQTILLFIFSLLFNTFSFAQKNTLVTGQIQNHNTLVKVVELRINNRYINNEVDIYESNLLSDGTFAFAAEINEPQYATLVYLRDKFMVYLEPNDTLRLLANGSTFPKDVSFSGKGGANNRYLYKYLSEHPKEMNPFKKIQYKKGTYWFRLDPDMDAMMKNNHPEAFKQKMAMQKEQSLTDLNFNVTNHPGEISSAFHNFMSTEIIYDWAYNVLLYGSVFKNKHQLTDAFFTFLDEVPIQNEIIGNYRYRDFLMAYLNYQVTKNNLSPEQPYLRQYEKATELLSDRALAFAQSEIIYNSFGKKQIEEIIGKYWSFVENTDHPEFSQKVEAIYEKAVSQRVGAPAPDFKLIDNLDRNVTLSSYKEQVVLLNFWASWCKPCMRKMRIMQPLEEELRSKGVVFMNISLDKNPEVWKSTIEREGLVGVHLLADNNIESQVAKDYQVRILPQYFLINKGGNFAEKPKQFKSDDLRMVLNRLSR